MYGFYAGTSYKNGKEFYCANPLGESEEYEDLTIEDAEFYKGQQFIYLFDFGDRWEFKIQVIDFIENEEMAFEPQIIESKGKDPQQYPDWEGVFKTDTLLLKSISFMIFSARITV